MPWAAIIATGVSLYGASQDKKAQKSSNAANYAQVQQALDFLGWPGQGTFSMGGPSYTDTHAASIRALEAAGYGVGGGIAGSAAGGSLPKPLKDAFIYLYSGTAEQQADAKKYLTSVLGANKFQQAYSAGLQGLPQAQTGLTAWGQLNQRFQEAERFTKQSGQALVRGARQANRAIAQTGAGAQQEILRQGERSFERGVSGLTQSGLLNTSMRAGLARSNRNDISRSLTQLAGQLAPVRAQGQAALGAAEASAAGQLANLSQNRAQMEMQLALQRIGLLAGIQHMPGPGFLQSIGGAQGIWNFGQALGGINFGGGGQKQDPYKNDMAFMGQY